MSRPKLPDDAHWDDECWPGDSLPADVHWDDECERPALAAAVRSLHRQAHPRQADDPAICREEPCRSLSVEALRILSPARL